MRVLIVAAYLGTERQVAAAVLFHATSNLSLVPSNRDFYDPFTVAVVLAPLATWVAAHRAGRTPSRR